MISGAFVDHDRSLGFSRGRGARVHRGVDDAAESADGRGGRLAARRAARRVSSEPNWGVEEVRRAHTARDEGVGIAADDLERIFEPFHRGRDTASTIPGTGLGLSIARRIARAHGGDILVESRPRRGSTFTVTLPAPIDVAERAEYRAFEA